MPPSRRLAIRRAARRSVPEPPPPVELLAFDGEDPGAGPAIPAPPGTRLARVTSSFAFEGALRTFRRGVVAVVVPPAGATDLERLLRARRAREGLRILLVNRPDDAAARLDALAQGFDDAIPSSVSGDEIAGRLLVLAGRANRDRDDRLPVGPGLDLDLTARALRRYGRLVHLRPLEFRLLEQLARNPGRPISRRALLRDVWGTDGLDGSRTVDVHIRWLRSKVERDPERPQHLLTVRGVGYQLEPGLDVQDEPPAAAP